MEKEVLKPFSYIFCDLIFAVLLFDITFQISIFKSIDPNLYFSSIFGPGNTNKEEKGISKSSKGMYMVNLDSSRNGRDFVLFVVKYKKDIDLRILYVKETAAVAQRVRELSPQAEDWVFEFLSR